MYLRTLSEQLELKGIAYTQDMLQGLLSQILPSSLLPPPSGPVLQAPPAQPQPQAGVAGFSQPAGRDVPPGVRRISTITVRRSHNPVQPVGFSSSQLKRLLGGTTADTK